MDNVVRICGIALVGAISSLAIASIGGKMSFAVRLVTVVVIVGSIIFVSKDMLGEILGFVSASDGISSYYAIIMRTLSVALVAHLSADICRECGAESVAGSVEWVARVEIFVICLPLISEILGYAARLSEM